ncbi:MAG TPA: PDR/VanB family oxidoreductase [Casimicrobiaceae bacterium]|nr:PDR/VanB family oxidoreductase [Casimicrobiaceae bacterium]
MPDALDELTPLRVERADPAAEDIKLYELARADGGELPPFAPGAHVQVKTPGGLLRRYSIANAPEERDRYQIAVKRERNGRGGSTDLFDHVDVGATLEVSAPRNDFALTGNPVSYVFIAGGIGITPIRSMILHLRAARGKPFKLYYLSRTPAMTAFRDEFAALDYRGKVVMHYDEGDADRAYDLWPVLEKPKGAYLYCCGPRGLMESVRDMTGHWSRAAVHFEDFGSGQETRTADDKPFTVRLARSGAVVPVAADRTILETLRAHGVTIASSCESGTCGTCRVGLVAGEPDHRDLVLADYERDRDIMVCVSRARSPELVLDL